MQYFVFLAWIPFRVSDVDHMLYSVQKYIFFDFQTNTILNNIMENKFPVVLILLFIILHFIAYRKNNIILKISNFGLIKWISVLCTIMMLIFFFYEGSPENFIYFQF